MALLFLPFVSMLSPTTHELTVVSEEEKEQVNQWEEDEPREEQPQNIPQGMFK